MTPAKIAFVHEEAARWEAERPQREQREAARLARHAAIERTLAQQLERATGPAVRRLAAVLAFRRAAPALPSPSDSADAIRLFRDTHGGRWPNDDCP